MKRGIQIFVALAVIVGAGLVIKNNFFRKKKRVDGPEPAAATCLASTWPKTAARVSLQPMFDPLRFHRAVGLYQSPIDPKRWYVIEKEGSVWTFREGDTASTLYLDLREYGLRAVENEVGLLGMAFHPDFARNGRVFFSYTTEGVPLESHVAEFHGTRDGLAALGPPHEVLEPIPQFFKNHKGGDLQFGPDGYLYISLGDGKTPNDELENGQDTWSIMGKILRIDVDRGLPWSYAIPPDNPYADGASGRPEVWALGFRNVWRFAFDRLTGDMYAGDVGQHDWEELDKIVKGGNYGWDEKQGTHCFEAPAPCDNPEWIDPIAEHSHSEALAMIAGPVYRGRAMPELWGKIVYGDHATGRIWTLVEGGKPEVLVPSGPAFASFAEDDDGEIYVVGYGEQRYVKGATQGGRMFKLVPVEGESEGSAPVSLSRTGCTDPADPRKPAAGLIPYAVNHPQEGGGRRWLSLPQGKVISIGADGDWEIPEGAVVVQELASGDVKVETRVLVHHEDGEWSGFSYEWDPQQKDATLVADGKQLAVAGRTWTIPTRSQCLECHTRAAGRTLGLETAQMNRSFPKGTAYSGNQIDFLRSRKLFAEDPGAASKLPVAQSGKGSSVAERARAYLATNCSPCHRPGGTAPTEMDLRAEVPFDSMNVCNADPTQGDLGFAGAKIVTPGNAKSSILAIRPTRPAGQGRMPPFEMSAADPEEGAKLIASWIDSLTGCK